ncbi:MAG: ABC transporter substrate-binding protein [Flavobacteriaceae bacterium]|nr:ABC transporter substrate-binding protein [Flavobacteriaceae bacterium]
MSFLRNIIIIAFFVFTKSVFGQTFSDSWTGYFSFNRITDMSLNQNTIYAVSDNAAFSYDTDTNTVEKFSTIEGLQGEVISTNYFSETYGYHVIGYENGLLEIVLGLDDVLTEVDILNKPTIPADKKRINHIMEYGDKVYLSTDFGIVEYDLANLEFGETFFIGPNGTQISITQTTVHNDHIYASTESNAILTASVTNPDLIDFSQWSSFGNAALSWNGIESTGSKLFATTTNRRIYEVTASNTILFAGNFINDIVDLRFRDGFLNLTTFEQVFIYDADLTLTDQVNLSDITDFDSRFTCSIKLDNTLYIGTQEDGILELSLSDPTTGVSIKPSGPLFNLMVSIDVAPGEIWAVFGGHSLSYSFSGIPGVRSAGISHYVDEEWINIPYDSLTQVTSNRPPDFLNKIEINPNATNQVYASSFFGGLLEIVDNVPTTMYYSDNSSLEDFASFNLSLSSEFDRDGNLWTLTARASNDLNRFNGASWAGFSFDDILGFPSNNFGFSSMTIGNDGNKYIGTYRYGVIGFNEDGNQLNNVSEESGNLPDNDVKSVAIDNNNNLWIGTLKGLRVLFNASQLLTEDNPQTQPIIILEDGVPKELLFEQVLTDIVVDGANNKWVGTVSAGVFYFSSDGQETIYHFTKDNSPLPANDIYDIAIDSSNGEVFFATGKGLVSFNTGGSDPTENLEEVRVWPNPVRPEYKILGSSNLRDINMGVKIGGLTENVNLKITDVEGNLVAEAQSGRTGRFDQGLNMGIDGGTAIWNGRNFAGNIVASGVYVILISDLDSLETTVKKVMIVR